MGFCGVFVAGTATATVADSKFSNIGAQKGVRRDNGVDCLNSRSDASMDDVFPIIYKHFLLLFFAGNKLAISVNCMNLCCWQKYISFR